MENILSQTTKMKELFLKEYEDLIAEKNSQIKTLNEQLNQAIYEKKETENNERTQL